MLTEDAPSTSTALAILDPHQVAAARALLAKVAAGEKSLDEVLAGLVEKKSTPDVEAATPAREVVKVKDLTPAQLDALTNAADLHAALQKLRPDAARTEDDLKAIYAAKQAYDALETLAKHGKSEVFRALVADHLDRKSERDGLVDPATSRRDDKGHYLHSVKEPIPGSPDRAFVRTEKSGGDPKVSLALIDQLVADGKITRSQYLAMTRETRVLDTARAAKAMAMDPDLMVLVATQATVRPDTTASISVGKA
jgi:hypothetical protein